MAEDLMIYEVGDRFATITEAGWTVVWEIGEDGEPVHLDSDDPGHRYLSTYCLHGVHERCRLFCKICEAPCRCGCHQEQP